MNNHIKIVERDLNRRLITFEFGIILDLYPDKIKTSSELCSLSDSSYSTFYILIKNMLADGILVAGFSDSDKRVKLYRLSDQAVKSLSQLKFL